MQSSKAPDGFYTSVEITVHLAGVITPYHYAWNTPMGLQQAASKALGWAKLEMRAKKVAGRSKIIGLCVTANYRRLTHQQQDKGGTVK